MASYVEDVNNPKETVISGHGKMEEQGNGLDTMKYGELVQEAKEAADNEHAMSLLQGIKKYPKAVAWSILLSTALIMEGYDTVLLPSFFALPPFVQKFGSLTPKGTYELTAAWQSGLSNSANVGEIIGLIINGYVSDWIGYRKTMMISMFCMAAFVFIPFFATNVQTLLAGEILMGIPWGVFQTLTTTYASEVCPVVLRYYLTTYVNLCWLFGQLIASGVVRGFVNRTDEWAYRIPFALQWIWPAPLLVGVYFAPESPWWLVGKGRVQEAIHSVQRLSNDDEIAAEKTVAMMIHTHEIEKRTVDGVQYWDCFRGINLRRTELTCLVWAIQALCGASFRNYSTYFYEQAGLPVVQAFNFTIIQRGLGIIGVLIAWILINYMGRRSLYVYGLVIMDILLFLIGFLALAPSSNKGASWGIGTMLLLNTFFYDITVGPVTYCLVTEIPSNHLRSKSVVLARGLYNICSIVNGVITPYMLNPTAWAWGAKAGFFWGGICFLCLVWSFFRLPETKGRTYAELDLLFEMKVSARKFGKTAVDPYAAESVDSQNETHSLSHEENEKNVTVNTEFTAE